MTIKRLPDIILPAAQTDGEDNLTTPRNLFKTQLDQLCNLLRLKTFFMHMIHTAGLKDSGMLYPPRKV